MALKEKSGFQKRLASARLLPRLVPRWRVSILMVAIGCLGFSPHMVCAGESPLAAAAHRLRIEPARDAAWPASVGYVEISPVLKNASGIGVFDDQGKPVGCKTIWSAANQPTVLSFDTTSKARVYYVCFGSSLPSGPAGWSPQAGVLLETRPCAHARVATSAEVAQVISAAGPVQGRGYVAEMRSAINPFGPSSHYLANYTGWFRVATPNNYGFATDSSGPTILKVDGRLVTTWLGEHNTNRGRRAEHSGILHLEAGLHCLQYQHLQLDGERGCEVAWKPPGWAAYELMRPVDFLPAARFRATGFVSTTQPGQLYFHWHTEDICGLGDAMMLRVRFVVTDNNQPRKYRWRFDDGGIAAGTDVQHAFVQPGLRQVTLEAWEQGTLVASNTARVWIAADWAAPKWWDEKLYEGMKLDFLRQDLRKIPANELAKLAELAERADDQFFLRNAGKFMVQRAEELATPAAGGQFYRLGRAFAHQGDEGDAQAKTCYQLALAPSRAAGGLANKAKLRLAELLIDVYGQPDEAQSLMRQISGAGLSSDEVRLQKRLEGDLLWARGNIEPARTQYLALTPAKPAGTADLPRLARLEGISLMLEHKQFDEAWEALERLQLEFPLERLAPGTELIEVELALRRNGFRRAFTICQRLLPLADNSLHLPELLYHTVESGLALERRDEAEQALKRLQKEFPYSKAAAEANRKWSK